MKQSQFDILLAKMDEGFNKVNHRLDVIESDVSELKKDVSEIKIVLKKHDDLFVEHRWLNKSSFE